MKERSSHASVAAPFGPEGDNDPDPRVMPTRSGYLAVSRSDFDLRIGVIGQSEPEVRTRFAESVAAWRRLRTEPLPEGWGNY